MLDAAFLKQAEEMARPQIFTADINAYTIDRDGISREIRPELDIVETLPLYSLDAMVKMVKTEALSRYSTPVYIMAEDYSRVSCFLQPNKNEREKRLTLYVAQSKDVPGFKGEDGLPYESAIIALRTRFTQTADTEYLLRLLTSISNNAKVTYADNGIATSVVTTSGVSIQSQEAIKPIVALRPYRTFQEIEQPVSDFLIRITERGIKFIEADGGAWKLAARKTIAEYFCNHLEDEIEAGKVVVML